MSDLNIPNLTRLRNHLAQLEPSRFNMTYWFSYQGDVKIEFEHDCGTAACIGGWTDVLFSEDAALVPGDFARKTLGLTPDQEDELFYPGWVLNDFGLSYEDIKIADAVKTLDILIETGKVDWSHVQSKQR